VGQHVHALDHVLRDHVEVGIGQALAVDQHQGTVGTQAAQRHARCAVAAFQRRAGDTAAVAVVLRIGRVARDTGQLLDHITQRGRAVIGDRRAIDGHHRVGGFRVDAADQRAGDRNGGKRLGRRFARGLVCGPLTL